MRRGEFGPTTLDPFIVNLILTQDRAATIYAFDVLTRGNSPFLSNKRVFAVPVSGIPIGIKCDDKGHVYAGCSDGIEVWNSGGMLQAAVEIPGECDC